MKHRYLMIIVLVGMLIVSNVFGAAGDGNTTLGGVNGYIVIPSADPVYSADNATVATGYSALFSSSFAHVPFIQIGFAENFEASLAVDIATSTDVLLNAKWRFAQGKTSSIAVGIVGQALDLGGTVSFAGQLYAVSTFTGALIDWPAKTTVLIGYTFDNTLNTDIDFGMGFEIPFFEDFFKGRVNFLMDFGNVSYSSKPSGGNAADRGLLNVGLRMLPLEFVKSVFLSADLRAMDLFDHTGRALSAGISISFRQ